MCTAFNLRKNGHYFGRNLDLDRSLGEVVLLTPRNYPLPFRKMDTLPNHYALIGMGVMGMDLPLYYDAMNEKGLCMAGLNFPGNAVYHPLKPEKDNIAPYELIPWVLSQCATLHEAGKLLETLNLADIALHPKVAQAPLHWLLGDETGSLVIESREDGLHIHKNPVEVLTNNPPFPYQLFQLNNFRHLNPETPANTFAPGIPLDVYCQGLGGVGLPGDVSSMSRFLRAAFYLHNCQWTDPVGQVFHLLDSVKMLRGTCRTELGTYDETLYSVCMDPGQGKFYYTTSSNRRITCVDMQKITLDGNLLVSYPLEKKQDIYLQA